MSALRCVRIMLEVCWWSRSQGLKSWFKTNKLYISEAEWFEAVWRRPEGGVDSSGRAACRQFSLPAKKITNRGFMLLADLSPCDGRMVCGMEAITHRFSSSGRDKWLSEVEVSWGCVSWERHKISNKIKLTKTAAKKSSLYSMHRFIKN